MTNISPPSPLAYEGQVVVNFINKTFPPEPTFVQFNVPTIWVDTYNLNSYILVGKSGGYATWVLLNGTAPGVIWNEVTTTSISMEINNGYITNNSSLITLTLPTICPQGSEFEIAGKGVGGWKISQNSSQKIFFGNQSTTTGTSGYLASSDRMDCVRFLCITANLEFEVLSGVGNITFF